MTAYIDESGVLNIEADSPVESFALKEWLKGKALPKEIAIETDRNKLIDRCMK